MAGLSACAPPPDPTREWASYVAFAQLNGYMRTDRSPEDAKFSPAVLAQNFRKLGFSFETDPFGTGETLAGPEHIRKWRNPIRYTVYADGPDQERIERFVRPYVEDLADLTGHPITEVDLDDETMNMMIVFPRDDILRESLGQSADDQSLGGRALGPGAAGFMRDTLGPWYTADSPCAGQIWESHGVEGEGPGELLFALVMIRPEVPDLLLEACVEEELAQTLGLFNDDSSIRPTIFNDDQEFALLTQHDGLLLRILYDERLEPGMSPDRAMPLVREIADKVWWESR